MKPIKIAVLAIMIPMLLLGTIEAAQNPAEKGSAAAASSPAQNSRQGMLPASGGEERLRIYVGRSMVVKSPEPLKRVSVTDPAIASAVIVDPNQIMIHGMKPGTVTLLLWDAQEQLRSFDLQIQHDIRPLIAQLKKIFPDEIIEVSQNGNALVLTGQVSNQAVADKAASLCQIGGATVANMLRTKPQNRNTILLKVRFAEVDRAAIQQLGLNIFSTGAANTIGATSTQQFGAITGNVGAVPGGITRGRDPEAPNLAAGGIGSTLARTPSVFGLSDLLNIFVFRSDINLGVAIKALQQKNLLEMLAEPNLLAVNGKEASFLAGGEFPFPVVQGGTNFTAVTIQFKEFGVKLKFLANILDDGQIRLKVSPEVSSLDFSNALTISGFLIPALSTRRAETEVELSDGQSFAIAGLIDNRLTQVYSKVPGIGDVPILGKLFKSRSLNKNKTELMVLVTPTLVEPLDPSKVPPLPKFPMSFMDSSKSDGKGNQQDLPPTRGNNP